MNKTPFSLDQHHGLSPENHGSNTISRHSKLDRKNTCLRDSISVNDVHGEVSGPDKRTFYYYFYSMTRDVETRLAIYYHLCITCCYGQ